MDYISLSKIYYTTPTEHQHIYHERFNAPFTKHLDFSIRQFNRKKKFPAFFCYTEELVNVLEDVYSQHESLSKLLLRVPPIVLQQFARFNVIEEIQSTNDIEGVQSTRQELRETFEQASSSARFSGIINRYNNLVDGRDIAFDTCIDIRIFYNTFTYDGRGFTRRAEQQIGRQNFSRRFSRHFFGKW